MSGRKWATDHACEGLRDWFKEAEAPTLFVLFSLSRGPVDPKAPPNRLGKSGLHLRLPFPQRRSRLQGGHPYILLPLEIVGTAIQHGGDTDTTACIVGGLVGAAVGCHGIPERYGKTVLTYSASGKSVVHPRPDFLVPSRCGLVDMVESVIDRAPRALTIVDGAKDEKSEK